MAVYHALSGSAAGDLFIDLFSEEFGFLFPREWVEILAKKRAASNLNRTSKNGQ